MKQISGQINLFDYLKETAPSDPYELPNKAAGQPTEEKPTETQDDYIKENPTCFYVLGHYLDKAQGWHKVPEELPMFRDWIKVDVVIFGRKIGTAWLEHDSWEAKDWTFRRLDAIKNTESTEILAWKISDQSIEEG